MHVALFTCIRRDACNSDMYNTYSAHSSSPYLQHTSIAAVTQTLNSIFIVAGSEISNLCDRESTFSQVMHSVSSSHKAAGCLCQRIGLYSPSPWRSYRGFRHKAATVGEAVEAAGSTTGRSPTVNIDVGLQRTHTHTFTCWKMPHLLTFCCHTGSYTDLTVISLYENAARS